MKSTLGKLNTRGTIAPLDKLNTRGAIAPLGHAGFNTTF